MNTVTVIQLEDAYSGGTISYLNTDLESITKTVDVSGNLLESGEAVRDDVLATVEVMKEMEAEKADLERYVNLFGYNPKYGVEGKPIGSVTYKPQRYDPIAPLYQL